MRVQVVEDNAALRAVACLEIELSDDLELAGAAADGAEAISLARVHLPDAIILDLEMPGMSGIEALPSLVEIVPDALIVIYTSNDCDATRRDLLRQGAGAYVVKGSTPVRDVLTLVRNHRGAGLAAP